MSTPSQPILAKSFLNGSVTVSRKRRTLMAYGIAVLTGLLLQIVTDSAALHAVGVGLWFPGAGFLAVGGWWGLLCPLLILLFVAGLIAWLGSGMLLAPIIVWLGGAVLAGQTASSQIWMPGVLLAAAGVVGFTLFVNNKNRARHRAQLELKQQRNAYLPQAIEEISNRATPAQQDLDRELTPTQIASLRYSVDRGLQPLENWSHFTKIDQFQPAAYRYQLNNLGYTLALAQCHYTPNFHGYMSEAQSNIIEKFTRKENWQYWRLERLWGSLSTDFDPAKDDNIMLTGFYGINLGHYQSNTGDDCYAKDKALDFSLNETLHFPHNFHSVVKSIAKNMQTSDFCLFPCEPNWIYTPCNFRGLTSIALHDRLYNENKLQQILPTFLKRLDDEFTTADGNLLTVMSKHLGYAVPFPFGNDSRAHMMNAFAPDEAKKAWAFARNDLTKMENGELTIILSGKGVDFGNYSTGHIATLTGIACAAGEMGDTEVQQAALKQIEKDYPPEIKDGVAWYPASNGTRAWLAMAQFAQKDDWRNSVIQGPNQHALNGPLLKHVNYPAVLVAQAVSTDGVNLHLVLYGNDSEQTLSFTRLAADAQYRLDTPQGALDITAGNDGSASAMVKLNGRSELTLTKTQ